MQKNRPFHLRFVLEQLSPSFEIDTEDFEPIVIVALNASLDYVIAEFPVIHECSD